ncbi:hypothetical protein L1987_57399 [Smallanthus sonchifolius]|uniref:Uncharacterized protein n=1 Tax=Smallanthus sonchifolius TaxID=185202 RepID=A0ACB9DCW6_9ASTR|nr:hypothetical protein L1987_57399 [Smallanthus sonchifolius]
MYIYTMGERVYALEMANLLDPQKIYFDSRVIAQGDCTQRHQKGLDVVLGQESAVLILDDTEEMWVKHRANLILMERYHFFASSCKQFRYKCKSLSELKSDESEADRALATVLQVLKRIHNLFFDPEQGENFAGRDVRQLILNQRIRKMSNDDDGYKVARAQTPLSSIAQAFEEISDLIKKGNDNEVAVDLQLKPFCEACSLVSVLFGCLGMAFKFAEMEYTAKLRDLLEASKNFDTLSSIVDFDLKNKTVKSPGSHTRNLRRVRQGLDLIKELFQNFLSPENLSLKTAATTAYQQVCAPYHTWAVRTAASAGMCTLPTREQLLLNLNETDKSADIEMRRYIKASHDVIKIIDDLYISRGITLDW